MKLAYLLLLAAPLFAQPGYISLTQLSPAGASTNDCVTFSGGKWTHGSCGAAIGANTALSNLITTSINSSLLFQSAKDIGSTGSPVRFVYIYGGGTFGSTSIRIGGTPTAARQWSIPDRDDTFAGLGANTFTGAQDSSGASTTSPMKVGSSLPLTCSIGQHFMNSAAAAGANDYVCTATNTWSLLGVPAQSTTLATCNASVRGTPFTFLGTGTNDDYSTTCLRDAAGNYDLNSTRRVYDVKAYGATGDGSTLDTTAVQNTINAACSAGANGASTIWFPPGRFRLAAVTYNCAGLTFAGVNNASVLVPAANNTVMVAVNSAFVGTIAVHFRDLYFDASTFGGTNTVKGISLVAGTTANPLYEAYVQNCKFNNVQYAVYADRISNVWIDTLYLYANTSIFAGSTSDDVSNGYGHDIIISNVMHYPLGGVSMTTAVVQLQRAVGSTVKNLGSRGLSNAAKLISVLNDCQGIQIDGGGAGSLTTGVEVLSTTVGSTTAAPYDVDIRHVQFDQFTTSGVFSQGANTSVTNSYFTNGATSVQQYVYNSGAGAHVAENYFITGGGGSANGAVFEANSNWDCVNNIFSLQLTAGADIYVVSAGSDYFLIQNNWRRSTDTSTAFLVQNGTGVHRLVQNTGSWPN